METGTARCYPAEKSRAEAAPQRLVLGQLPVPLEDKDRHGAHRDKYQACPQHQAAAEVHHTWMAFDRDVHEQVAKPTEHPQLYPPAEIEDDPEAQPAEDEEQRDHPHERIVETERDLVQPVGEVGETRIVEG